VTRGREDALCGRALHNASKVHDDDTVRDVTHNAEIMADEKIS
jgi:hypothetical protein